MAVQAQHPANAFSPDLRTRMQSNLLEELQMLQGQDDNNNHQHQQLLCALNHGATPLVFNTHNNDNTAFSNPQSELTCIASGSKKRIRGESSVVAAAHHTPVSFAYPNPDLTRLIESAGTSTSGRTCSSSSSSSPIAQDIHAQIYHQSLEIDAMIRLQNERLRLGLEQAQKRHCRALISALEQQALKKLREKEAELENASRRNAELEEKVRQMSAENQIWFNVAKNNEAIVSSLRTSLEQVLLQNTVQAKEGYGDSEGTAFPADDAQSCCFVEGEEERTTTGAVEKKAAAAVATECCRRKCRVCGEEDVAVLLLPCRHLCLCKDCESKVDTCPVCHVTKNACLQIFMS